MRSAIERLPSWSAKRELRLFERLLQHAEHDLERFHPDGAAADRAEMLDLVGRVPAAARESHVDEALLMLLAGGAREARDADRDIGMAALQRTLGHGARDDLGDRLVEVEQARLDSEKLGLGLVGVGDEPALEAVARTLDVGEERGEH